MNSLGTRSSLKDQKSELYRRLGVVRDVLDADGGLRTFQLEPIAINRAECCNNEVVGVIQHSGFDCIASMLVRPSNYFIGSLHGFTSDDVTLELPEIHELFPSCEVNINWSIAGVYGDHRVDGLRSSIFGRAGYHDGIRSEVGFAGAFAYRQLHLMDASQWMEYERLTRGLKMYGFFGDWKFEIEAPPSCRFVNVNERTGKAKQLVNFISIQQRKKK